MIGLPANAPQGNGVDLRLVTRHGRRRGELLERADDELEAIVAELERAKAGGQRVNVALAARLAGVARDTIYARLRSRAAAPENTQQKGST